MSKRHIFVSHAWKYDSDYNTVINWLNSSNLDFSNYSVPSHDPLDAYNTKKLENALTKQISPSNIVIAISGMYASHSNWIKYEIDEAVRMEKIIIGLKPWGQERIPLIISNAATEMVGWNSSSLINAIKKY